MRYIKSLIHRILFGKPECHLTFHIEVDEDNAAYWVDAYSEALGKYEKIGYVRGYNPYHMVDLGKELKKKFPLHAFLICDHSSKAVADFTKPLLYQ